MQPEQQISALAAVDGWRIIKSLAKNHWVMEHRGVTKEIFSWDATRGQPTLLDRISDLPDYLHDLNAVHDVECRLFCLSEVDATLLPYAWSSRCKQYINELYIVTHSTDTLPSISCIVATSSQRCEAILRILDLWKQDAA